MWQTSLKYDRNTFQPLYIYTLEVRFFNSRGQTKSQFTGALPEAKYESINNQYKFGAVGMHTKHTNKLLCCLKNTPFCIYISFSMTEVHLQKAKLFSSV